MILLQMKRPLERVDCLYRYRECAHRHLVERAVRPFTNLRKSFGGFSSELGGEVAAAWLTFVESCKLQKKAALEVFNGYFQRIAQGRRDYDLITEEVLC